MSDAEPTRRVRGERDNDLRVTVPSAQSRASNVLAIALMSVLGLGSLTWYYANAMMRQGRAKENAAAASARRAQGDMALPSLGRIGPPVMPGLFEPVPPPDSTHDGPPPNARTLAEIPLGPSATSAVTGMPPVKTPEELAMERELSGAVFSSHGGVPPAGAASMGDAPSVPANAAGSGFLEGGSNAGSGDMAALLRPTATAAVRAQLLPAQRLLLPKGAFLDCTLETAIDSTLPGMTTCVTATDTFGVDGKVVLLERGTKLIGETRGQVQQGAARIFVLWTEARTPAGVVLPLDSPGADELGRSGLPGEVNRHFWQRFGAALLVSVIDGAVQAATQSSGAGVVVVNPAPSQGVLTEILKDTISIPPTVVKRNGDRIQVLVARDVDFRSVYELRYAITR
jgi:type IV secretion system protein VirB10